MVDMKLPTNSTEFSQALASFTNYERLQTFRYDQESFDLRRMEALAAALGNPHNHYPCMNIYRCGYDANPENMPGSTWTLF